MEYSTDYYRTEADYRTAIIREIQEGWAVHGIWILKDKVIVTYVREKP